MSFLRRSPFFPPPPAGPPRFRGEMAGGGGVTVCGPAWRGSARWCAASRGVARGSSRPRWVIVAVDRGRRVPVAVLSSFRCVRVEGAGRSCVGVAGVDEVGDGGLVAVGCFRSFFGGTVSGWFAFPFCGGEGWRGWCVVRRGSGGGWGWGGG